MHRCASLQFQKVESLISFHAQVDYCSEFGEYYQNTICTPYLIRIYPETAHTTGFLEQYIQNIYLCHLNQRSYQLPTMFFLLKLIINYIHRNATYPYWTPQVTLWVSLYKYKIILKDLNRQKTFLVYICYYNL